MTTAICTSSGLLPEIHTACEHYDSAYRTCGLPLESVCSARRIRFTKEEINDFERVELTPSLRQLQETVGQTKNPYSLFTAASYEAVREALELIDRVAALYTGDKQARSLAISYLDDHTLMEYDAIKLTSLFATINVLVASAEADAKQAEYERKMMQVRKGSKVREAFENNIRVGKITEKGIEALVDEDSEIQEARRVWLKADRAARILRAMVEAIPEHVNMLKRRIDGLRQELRYAKHS